MTKSTHAHTHTLVNFVYLIILSVQVTCDTLHDMISYLVTSTDGVLIPLIIEQPYEKKLCMYRT